MSSATPAGPLLDWLAGTGCTQVAIHFDVDTIDSDEIVLGLGAEPGGLTSVQVRRIVGDARAAGDASALGSSVSTPATSVARWRK